MRIKTHIIFWGILLSIQAESQHDENNSIDLSRTVRDVRENNYPALSQSPINSGESVFKIHTGTDKDTAFLRLKSEYIGNTNLKWNLSIEAPFDEEENPSILGDFDGLSNVNNISFDISGIRLINPFENIDSYNKWKVSKCNEYLELDKKSKYWNQGCTEPLIRLHYKNKGNLDSFIDDLIKKFRLERAKKYSELVENNHIDSVKAHIYGATLKTGYKNYKYRNSETIAKEDADETSWSLSLYYNYLVQNSSFGIGLNVQESYKENDEIQLCEPLDQLPDSLSCTNVRIGSPEEQRRQILYFMMSHNSHSNKFAIQPKVSYDFEEDEIGITVPIFLLRNESNQFTGGLQLSWQSEDNDIIAGVFVGRQFKLF